MPEFFAEVEEVKACISEIKQATDKINEICEKAAFAATQAEEKALSEELEPVQKRANARAQQASRILKRQSAETKQMNADKQNEKRVRTHLQETLTRTFGEGMHNVIMIAVGRAPSVAGASPSSSHVFTVLVHGIGSALHGSH